MDLSYRMDSMSLAKELVIKGGYTALALSIFYVIGCSSATVISCAMMVAIVTITAPVFAVWRIQVTDQGLCTTMLPLQRSFPSWKLRQCIPWREIDGIEILRNRKGTISSIKIKRKDQQQLLIDHIQKLDNLHERIKTQIDIDSVVIEEQKVPNWREMVLRWSLAIAFIVAIGFLMLQLEM